MAAGSTSMPDPSASAPPQAGGGAGAPPSPQGGATPPSQGPANQIQQLLGKWSQAAQEMATAYPQIAAELNAIVQKIGEAQTKLISPPQPTPMSQQPSYS